LGWVREWSRNAQRAEGARSCVDVWLCCRRDLACTCSLLDSGLLDANCSHLGARLCITCLLTQLHFMRREPRSCPLPGSTSQPLRLLWCPDSGCLWESFPSSLSCSGEATLGGGYCMAQINLIWESLPTAAQRPETSMMAVMHRRHVHPHVAAGKSTLAFSS
jgi:hypothetical protein